MQALSVVRVGDTWTITSNGMRWGRFAYRVDAEEAALRLAEEKRAQGEEVEVLVQDRWGRIVPVLS